MKKILALLISAVLLLGLTGVSAEGADKYEKLTVATTTGFSGNFFSETLGNNICDQDVRRLIHGYNLVFWDSAVGAYQFNSRVVTAAVVSEDGMSFTFAIAHGLTYNDGTPITAKDYAFSLLLLGSKALEEACGGRQNLARISGGKAYMDGETPVLSGFRILDDYMFSMTMDPSFYPYFYQLKALDVFPLPINVIAPGCVIKDDGEGAYIGGPFSAEQLQKTLNDPNKGYISHPSVTCGPYSLVSFNGTEVVMELNPAYGGNANGDKPTIPKIVFRVDDPDQIMEHLAAGEVDLVVRCARADQIAGGMGLTSAGGYAMKAYSRNGLAFIDFCAEKGPTADVNVRKALAHCIDRNTLTTNYLGAYGTTVQGYYGIGQWMYMMANGTLVPEEGAEEEWADLTLDRIVSYGLDTQKAASYLDLAGWNLNETGGAYNPQAGGLRYKDEGGSLVPLKLKMIYAEGNGTGPILDEVFVPYLKEVGIELEIEQLPVKELLEKYYGQAERDCDMIMLGTNFGDVYDPSTSFNEEGKDILSGVTDPHLAELAENLRSTEPGNATEYCRRWLAFVEYRSEILPEIPLYSDAYLDFHIVDLQQYEPGSTGNWSIAVTSAVLSEYVPAAEEEGADEFEEDFE